MCDVLPTKLTGRLIQTTWQMIDLCGDTVHSIDVIVTLIETSVNCGLVILIISRIAVSLNSSLALSIHNNAPFWTVLIRSSFFKGKAKNPNRHWLNLPRVICNEATEMFPRLCDSHWQRPLFSDCSPRDQSLSVNSRLPGIELELACKWG